ncbi:MAG: polysaccharide deacetylase family protein [Chitinophagaceae bacterium]|nr:polysaccharide deacetylase family protein [Oligoflexus sp.]
MPSGHMYDFGKKAGLVLSLLGLGLGLESCGLVKKKSDTCNLKADGLTTSAYSGDTLSDKHISLIFLKGPSEATPAIGTYLDSQSVHATFFVQGSLVKEHESDIERLVEQGHQIGTGGFSFTALATAQDPVLELRTADALITPFAHGNQYWLYGERGSLDKDALTQLQRAGLGKYVGPIHGDTTGAAFVSDDQCWEKGMTVETCADGYFNEITRIGHGLIPLHDTDEHTGEMLKVLVPELLAYGMTFVRLDQVPKLRLALTEVGGTPDASIGAAACNDYE